MLKNRPSGPLFWYNNVLLEIRYIQWTQQFRICSIILNNDGNKAISWNTASDNGNYDILVTNRSPSQIFKELLREKLIFIKNSLFKEIPVL
jgi:exopolysaccharide biosynthesis predicted pyruvyltransferase EpsI